MADIALLGAIRFRNSKTGDEGYTTRSLSRYMDQVRTKYEIGPMALWLDVARSLTC